MSNSSILKNPPWLLVRVAGKQKSAQDWSHIQNSDSLSCFLLRLHVVIIVLVLFSPITLHSQQSTAKYGQIFFYHFTKSYFVIFPPHFHQGLKRKHPQSGFKGHRLHTLGIFPAPLWPSSLLTHWHLSTPLLQNPRPYNTGFSRHFPKRCQPPPWQTLCSHSAILSAWQTFSITLKMGLITG